MFIAILLAPVFGLIGVVMARSRTRNAMAWGIACFVTGIFGIITLLLVGTDPSLAARISASDVKCWNTLLQVDADIAAAAAKVGAVSPAAVDRRTEQGAYIITRGKKVGKTFPTYEALRAEVTTA